MAERLDLERHRQTLNEKLASLSKQLEQTTAGNEALADLTRYLLSAFEYLEALRKIDEANSLLFEKLILGAARLSTDYEGFKEMCRQLEEHWGYYPKKES